MAVINLENCANLSFENLSIQGGGDGIVIKKSKGIGINNITILPPERPKIKILTPKHYPPFEFKKIFLATTVIFTQSKKGS